jgi:glucokinase
LGFPLARIAGFDLQTPVETETNCRQANPAGQQMLAWNGGDLALDLCRHDGLFIALALRRTLFELCDIQAILHPPHLHGAFCAKGES